MDNIYRQSLLFDCYGDLLTKKQREIFRLHLQEDWSLGEIAEEMDISRQGVHDTLKKGIEALERYEGKLHIVTRMQRLRLAFEQLEPSLEKLQPSETESFRKALLSMTGLE